ncbi:hypothetical protein PNP59_10575 [Halobacterium salinarum]|uniref:hypothetical protein n=1 Tax=Halobacterium salinarum TaxID=2242 RepID=UPI002556720E|nr:hypothetical protein [Halobacterium salinarum]MDL0131374.1 hypothetical protein [Halobacterium salinarum]
MNVTSGFLTERCVEYCHKKPAKGGGVIHRPEFCTSTGLCIVFSFARDGHVDANGVECGGSKLPWIVGIDSQPWDVRLSKDRASGKNPPMEDAESVEHAITGLCVEPSVYVRDFDRSCGVRFRAVEPRPDAISREVERAARG